MALKRPAAPQQAPGAFEGDEVTTEQQVGAAQAQAGVATEAAAAADAAAKVEASTAIAKAGANTAVARPRGKMRDFVGELENALPPIGYGEAPKFTVAGGTIKDADKNNAGSFIEVSLLSWNFRYVVRPGSQDESAKEFVKYSLSKDVFDDGTSVADYIKRLQTQEDLPNASLEEYVELVGLLVGSEKPHELVNSGSLVVVSLSPDSVKTFTSCRRDTAVGVMLGTVQPTEQPLLRLSVEARSAKGRDWARFVVKFVQG